MRKAFDLVDHELIIHKLQLYGCNDISLQWLTSYLEDRYQSVSYVGHLSDPLPVTLGVPEVSILSPLLFIMFMNDQILEVENTHLEMYADDSTLCTADESVESINNTLAVQFKAIYHWVNVNQMILNVDKTECMLLDTFNKLRDALYNFSVGEDEYIVAPVSSHKVLGIHVDNILSWKTHITHLCSKLRSRLYIFTKLST